MCTKPVLSLIFDFWSIIDHLQDEGESRTSWRMASLPRKPENQEEESVMMCQLKNGFHQVFVQYLEAE